MIVDFHVHLSPTAAAGAGAPRARYQYGLPVYTDHALLRDVEALLRAIDEAGIDVAVLSSGHGLTGEVDAARRANEALARVVDRRPERLRWLAHVPSPAVPDYVDEVERWLDRCPGVAVASDFGRVTLDDERLEPLYEVLERRGRYLWIHPSLGPKPSDRETYGAYDLYRTVGREFSLALGTLRLILGGVLDRHPGLRVVVSHLGGGISALVPRIRHFQDKTMWGIAGDPVHGQGPARPFDEYLARIWFDTGGFFCDPAAVRIALQQIPPARLVLGSDYPQEVRGVAPIQALMVDLERQGLLGQGAELLGAG